MKKIVNFLFILSLLTTFSYGKNKDDFYKKIDLFGEVLDKVEKEYVEEIDESRVNVSVNDDKSLREATIKKEKINREEKMRVSDLVKKIPLAQKHSLKWDTQSIFGRRGYSIGHYARIVRADLLIMNAQEESTFINRFFPKDLEHILAELPTDVLIIQS